MGSGAGLGIASKYKAFFQPVWSTSCLCSAQLLAQKTLDLRTERHKLLSSNVANLDTPGYQAEDLVFENSLVAALEAETPGPLKVTDERHLDGNDTPLLDTVEGQRIRSATPFADFDGNTVDLDKEMAKMAEAISETK